MSNSEVLQKITASGEYRMPIPLNCPPALYEIMLKTWHSDPLQRPTFNALQSMLEELLFSDGKNYREADEVL